jgi:glycosyltransferase involved in cell wall biosynthesis
MATGILTHINLAPGFRGGERQTELLIRGLATRGWQQRLVVRSGGVLAGRLADVRGLEVREAGFGVAGAALALRGAGLVHSHEGRGVQAAWLAHALAGIPYVVTRRVQQGPRPTVANRLFYGRAAAVVALSAAIRTALARLDPALRVEVIPSASSGLPTTAGEPARLRTVFGGGHAAPFLVGHVGALVDSHKGQSSLIAVARRVAQDCPDLQFVFVGSGSDEARFRAQAAGLANVHFAGHTDAVGDYLAAFDLFAYPSRHEGLGSILLDALESGLPVVATRVGGIPEIITDGENGILCEPGDLDALERAVRTFRDDAGLRARVAAANRGRAAAWSAAVMTDRYAALYDRLAGSGVCPLQTPKETST